MTATSGGPVPPIPELRKIAQSSKTDQRLTYRIFRIISIRITWLLLHTRISANQVTVLSLLVALVGLVMTASPAPGMAILGCALLILYHTLDRVDGEVARFRQKYSLYGIYLDNLGHYITGAGLLIAIAYRLGTESSRPELIWLVGSVAALATMLVRVEKHAPFHLFSQYVLDHPDLLKTVRVTQGSLTRSASESERAAPGRRSPVGIVREVVLTLTWFPITVLVVAVGLVLEGSIGSNGPSIVVFLAVAAVQLLAWAGIEIANLTQNLGTESWRLARQAGVLDSTDEE